MCCLSVHLSGRIESICSSVELEAKKLHRAILLSNAEDMGKASRVISDRMHQLSGHCNINLVNDALRYWQNALKESGTNDLHAVSHSAQLSNLIGR